MARLAAEQAGRISAEKAGRAARRYPAVSIYGPGRNAIRTLRQGRARRLIKPGQVFTASIVADIGRRHALLRPISWAASTMSPTTCPRAPGLWSDGGPVTGVAPPPETDFETRILAPWPASFLTRENKSGLQRENQVLAGYEFLSSRL